MGSLVFVVASYFASCPYIRFCVMERQPRLGDSAPSILTEILPEIVWGIPGLIFLIFVLTGEYSLCSYLDAVQHDRQRSLAVPATLLVISSTCAFCNGLLLRTNSVFYITMGASVITALFALGASDGGSQLTQAAVPAPAAAATACMLLAGLRNLRQFRDVVERE